MFSVTSLGNTLRAVSSALQQPVIFILMVLICCTVLLAGSLVAEFFTERMRLKVKMPQLVDDLKDPKKSTEQCIKESGLLKRQKAALIELTKHPELTNSMREALAVRLLYQEQSRYDVIVKLSDIISKLGPMFGLLGTLIPLGPGIIALGQGDTYTLSTSLLIAFDTTVAGLASAAVTTVISMLRKSWYANYMSILETLMECVLEVEKTDD